MRIVKDNATALRRMNSQSLDRAQATEQTARRKSRINKVPEFPKNSFNSLVKETSDK